MVKFLSGGGIVEFIYKSLFSWDRDYIYLLYCGIFLLFFLWLMFMINFDDDSVNICFCYG